MPYFPVYTVFPRKWNINVAAYLWVGLLLNVRRKKNLLNKKCKYNSNVPRILRGTCDAFDRTYIIAWSFEFGIIWNIRVNILRIQPEWPISGLKPYCFRIYTQILQVIMLKPYKSSKNKTFFLQLVKTYLCDSWYIHTYIFLLLGHVFCVKDFCLTKIASESE